MDWNTVSFESFSESVSGPLSYDHIALILSRFEAAPSEVAAVSGIGWACSQGLSMILLTIKSFIVLISALKANHMLCSPNPHWMS